MYSTRSTGKESNRERAQNRVERGGKTEKEREREKGKTKGTEN